MAFPSLNLHSATNNETQSYYKVKRNLHYEKKSTLKKDSRALAGVAQWIG